MKNTLLILTITALTGCIKPTQPITPPVATAPFTNSIGMVFVPVPGTDVRFSIYDTRVQDYRADYNEHINKSMYWCWNRVKFPQTELDPVVNVDWYSAGEFCEWLTEKEHASGLLSLTQFYRLPTDAEWSIAAGLTEANGTPRENNGKTGTPNIVGNYDPKFGMDDYEFTSPVGVFPPNKFGLYDMGGNVWQWCGTRYDADQMVLRGGSWNLHDERDIWPSVRMAQPPETVRDNNGFRVVLVGK